MFKSFPGLVVVTIIFVGLAAGEITVTFEPHNQTEEATLYGENSGNLHSIGQSQGPDEEEVETFYVRSGVSEAEENRDNIPATQTHSPITEPDDRQLAIEPINQKVYWPLTGESRPCPSCQVQPPTTYPQYPTHPVFPSLGGGESYAPIENDAEYINGGGGGQQVVFVNPPQQQPDYHPSPPVFSPLQPEYPVQQQPSHPSIIYVPYQPTGSSGPPQLPWYGNEQAGGHFGDGFNDERFSGGSAHRNHEQIWRLHQQQHQLWLQQQRQQQQHQFDSIVIGGGGGGSGDGIKFSNLGTVGRRPCDSKK